MATQVDLGKIRPVWKGDWAASTAYEQNDMVRHGVNSYICVTAHTSGSSFSDTNWHVIAYGSDIPAQAGNAGKALKTDGTNLSWGNGGGVIQTFRKEFNTQGSYGGNGVEIALYRTSYSGLTVGNKLVVWVHMFGEAQHDMSLYVNRNGTRLLEGSGGNGQGKFTPKYDQNEDSTPNLGGIIFIDDIVSSTQEYRYYKEGNTNNWNVNRCYNSGDETGTTCIVAQEVLP
jgi:hypothetical protein